MRKLLCLACLLPALIAAPCSAGTWLTTPDGLPIDPANPLPMVQKGGFTPVGYCQLAAITTATGLSSCPGGVPSGALIAQIVATTAINYRDDGTAPTSSAGMPVPAGFYFSYGAALSAIQFIPQSGAATVNVSFYK